MSINVFNIENLFWNNSSYKVPNTLPPLEPNFINSSPVLLDFLSGYIDLYGEWNYCEYKGVYYILKKSHPLDLNKKHWSYVLVRDIWVNLLISNRVRVKGYAVTWNDDKLLGKHINKCVHSLDTPQQLTHLNFAEKEYEWKKDLKIVPASYDVPSKVLGRDGFMHMKSMVNGEWTLKQNIATKYFYKERPELFIFGSIEPADYFFGWQKQVVNKVNESLKDFLDPEKANKRVIVKTTAIPEGSPLRQLYAVSYSEESIGSGEEAGVELSEIDLSQLKDIVPIRWDNLKQPEPNKPLTLDTATFPTITENLGVAGKDWIWKLCRKAYLPIRTQKNKDAEGILQPDGNSYASASGALNWFTEPAQKLTFSDSHKPGFLWWADRLDFVLAWDEENVRDCDGAYSCPWKPWIRPRKEKHLVMRSYPSITFHASDYWANQISKRMKDKTPAYGFLMYQTERIYENWNLYEYLGETPIKQLQWFSGISLTGTKRYSDPKNWFTSIPNKLASIAGNELISKIHLDLNNFSWLYFAPKCKSYEYAYDYEDGFKHWSFVNYNYWTIFAVNSDIYKDGKIVRTNPYTIERYLAFDQDRRKILKDITLKDTLELPWALRKGDYFFSSLEYEFRQYKGEYWSTNEADLSSKYWQVGVKIMAGATPAGPVFSKDVTFYNILHNRSLLEDFYSQDPPASISPINKKLVLCNNRKGGVEFRVLESFSHVHTLSRDKNQIVHSVNDSTSKQITYYRLHRDGLGSYSTDRKIDNQKIIEFLYLFYKVQGYPVSISINQQGAFAKWLWYDEQDLNSEEGVLFDLVGTSWYAFLRKDKVHLICKRDKQSELFNTKKHKVNFLEAGENMQHLSKLPLIAKVNQKNVLSIFTKPFFLKTKFLFQQGDNFNISSKAYDSKDVSTTLNSYLITAKNQFDLINEWIHVPKKVTAALKVPDQIQQDMLKLELQRAREDFDFFKGRDVELAYKKHQTAFERAEWDNVYAGVKQGLNLFSSFMPEYRFTNNFFNNTMQSREPSLIKAGHRYSILKWPQAAISKAGSMSTLTTNVAKPIGALLNTIVDWSVLRPEMSRRNKENLEYATKDIAYRDFELNLHHFRRKQDALLHLNSVSNIHERGELNDLALIEEYNKENKLNNFNLRVYTPTEQQLIYLEEFREEFGVDCYIPDVEFLIYSGMPPNVVRLLKIEDDGILGVEDVIEREALKNRLEGGIKIVDVSEGNLKFPKLPEETIDVSGYVQEIKELHQGTTLNQQQIDALEEELENEKKERKDDVRKLKKDLEEADQKLRNASEAAKVLDQQNKKCSRELEACSKRVEALQEFAEGADKLQKLQEELNIANNRIEQDRGKIQVLEDEIRDKDAEIKELEENKPDPAAITTLQNEVSKLNTALESANKNVETLTAKKEELEGQIVLLAATKKPTIGYTKEQLLESIMRYIQFIFLSLEHGTTSDYKNYRATEMGPSLTDFFKFWPVVGKRIKDGGNPYFADTQAFVRNTQLVYFLAGDIFTFLDKLKTKEPEEYTMLLEKRPEDFTVWHTDKAHYTLRQRDRINAWTEFKKNFTTSDLKIPEIAQVQNTENQQQKMKSLEDEIKELKRQIAQYQKMQENRRKKREQKEAEKKNKKN